MQDASGDRIAIFTPDSILTSQRQHRTASGGHKFLCNGSSGTRIKIVVYINSTSQNPGSELDDMGWLASLFVFWPAAVLML